MARFSRSGLWIVPASMLAFAAAGYVAARIVPVGYEAALGLSIPGLAEGDKLLRDVVADAYPEVDVATSPASGPGIVIARAAATAGEAERALQNAADGIADRVAERLTQALPATAERADTQAAARQDIPEAARPEADPPVLSELRSAAEAARVEFDATSLALDEFEAGLSETIDDRTDRVRVVGETVASLSDDLGGLERARQTLASRNLAATQARNLPRFQGREAITRLLELQGEASADVQLLSRTLLDGHPRMAAARARLRDVDARLAAERASGVGDLTRRIETLRTELATARKELAAVTADASRRDALALRGRELVRARDLARAVSSRLDDAIRRAEEAASVPVPAPSPARTTTPAPVAEIERKPTPTARLERTPLPTRTRHAAPLPVASVSALFGLALATFGLLLGHRRPVTDPDATPIGNSVIADEPPTMNEQAAPTGLDVVAIDDVIDATIASSVTRIMLSGAGSVGGARPLAVSIARRLALRGRAVALVDLSASQASSRTMGIGPVAATLADLIEGRATFAAVAARDFATRAEIVPGGSWDIGSRVDALSERRNALDFAENSYEAIVVDCTGIGAETVAALMDADAALLLAVDGCDEATLHSRIETLKGAGLVDMILVREGAAP